MDFSSLQTANRTATFWIPGMVGADPTKSVGLVVKPTTASNAAYLSAVAQWNAKHAKAHSGSQVDVVAFHTENLRRQRALCPAHVVVGFVNMPDTAGQVVEYSPERAREIFRPEADGGLPDWIVSRLGRFTDREENFLGLNEPTEQEVDEYAGN